jgi:hypothetical protein
MKGVKSVKVDSVALAGLTRSGGDCNPQLTLWANDLTPLTGLWIPAFAGMTRKRCEK